MGALLPHAAIAGRLTGTASYRERIALPPDAVFEAVLIDSALADAPARELGRFLLQPAGQSPFHFTIPYRDRDIRTGGRYSVRSTVRQGDRLLFTTDTFTPVLSGGPDRPLTLQLVQVHAEIHMEGLISTGPTAQVDLARRRTLVVQRFVDIHPGKECP